MRICLASIHPRMLSGQIEALVALAAALEKHGHTVRLVSAFSQDQLHAEQRWEVETSDSARLTGKVVRMAGIIRQLVRASRGCEILHFNVPTPSFAAVADLVGMITRKPLVVGFEAHLANVPAAAGRLRVAPEFYLPRIVINNGLVARATLHRGRRYIVSSELQREELVALNYDRNAVDVIPNLIDHDKLTPVPRKAARAALGLPDAPLVIFAGHYHDVKGHDILIEAFRLIRGRVPAARLVLAWSGIGHQARVQRQIADAGLGDAIIELGRVPIGQLFSAADVVALPYRMTIGQAAFPGTVLEAMAVGVPIVTTDLPLMAELVQDGKTGLLAKPENPAHLGEQIAKLLEDEPLCQQMIESQHATMSERFDPDRLTTACESTYEKALAGKTRVLQTI